MTHSLQIFKTACSYCGVGCGIEILKHGDGRLELRGDLDHPANRGLLCAKGRSLLHTLNARDTRLHYPTMRVTKEAPRERVSWDTAMMRLAGDFQRIIRQHGPDSVAFYVSGQCLTEEYYLANKIAKGFLGTNNIDTNSRLCMSSAVCGYKATLGADGPPVCYDDIDSCDTFLIAGANPAWCHPVLFRRIEARKAADPSVRIIVIDPRKTASAQTADLHLQLRPGTDVALFLGIARRLVHTQQIDRDFLDRPVDGTHAFLRSAEPWTLARTAEVTGLDPADIAQAADLLAGHRRFLSLWTMGLNQSAAGTDKNIALISLFLLTGKIGRPGCGPFSLTGQPNAMGGREVGGMATLLPAHRNLANPLHRAQVASFWGVPAIPANPGLTAVELFDAVAAGKVKAVWIIATNPIASMPAAWQVEKALAAAELVVVQDIYPTETAHFADVILPAAGWLEIASTPTPHSPPPPAAPNSTPWPSKTAPNPPLPTSPSSPPPAASTTNGTMTKTSHVNRLRSHIDSPFCEIHPQDAAPRHIRQDDILTLRNPRGTVRVRAVLTDTVRPGVVFLPMHWGKKLTGDKNARGRANNLTSPRVYPVSKEPDLKFAAVQVERFTPPKRRIVIIGAGAADLFIFATGTLPNKELAGAASGGGLDCAKGIPRPSTAR